MQTDGSFLHRTFTVAVDLKRNNLIALKFVKKYNNESVYLAPRSNKIRTRETNVPKYFFKFGLRGNVELLEEINPADI